MGKQERPILIIDAMNNFLRHFLVNGAVNNKSEPVGGVVGFIKFIDYLSSTFVPQKIFVVWETGGGSKRRKSIFKEYKSNRSKIKEYTKESTIKDQLATDENCKVQQLSTLYKILKKTPICQIFVSGTECDDIIAYLITQQFRMNNSNKIIVSCDKDFYQLLEYNNVSIYDPARRSIITNKDVYEKYNIAPRNFCLARAIVGDISDNIGGVPGVGLKTASKRFSILADQNRDIMISDIIDECKKQITNGAKQKVYKDIIENESIVRRNWKLMYLDSSILSATDIAKIQYTIENHDPIMDKLGLIKEILSSGISFQFDFDDFSSRLRSSMSHVD